MDILTFVSEIAVVCAQTQPPRVAKPPRFGYTPFSLYICVPGDPNPVNVNYGLQLANGKDTSQTVTAAKLIAGAIDFKLLLDKYVCRLAAHSPLCTICYAFVFRQGRSST